MTPYFLGYKPSCFMVLSHGGGSVDGSDDVPLQMGDFGRFQMLIFYNFLGCIDETSTPG